MLDQIKKSDLCESERELVQLLRGLGFGRVEDLEVRDGRPVFYPPPRVIATLTLGSDIENRGETRDPTFCLKQQIIRLLLLIRQIRSGKVLLIVVRHGLPITVEVDGAVVRGGALAK